MASMASIGSNATGKSYASIDASNDILNNRKIASILSFRDDGFHDDLLYRMNPVSRTIFNTLSRLKISQIMNVVNILNTIVLALQATSAVNRDAGWTLSLFDAIFLGFYMAECALKLCTFGHLYFQSGWNVFGKSWNKFHHTIIIAII